MPGPSYLMPSARHPLEHIDISPVDEDDLPVQNLDDAVKFSVYIVRPVDHNLKRNDIEESLANHLLSLKALLAGIRNPIDRVEKEYIELCAIQEAIQFTPLQIHYSTLVDVSKTMATPPVPRPRHAHVGKPVVSGVPTLPVRQIASPGPARSHSPIPSAGQQSLASSPRLYRHPI